MREWNDSAELKKEYPKLGDYITHITKLQHQKFKKERMHEEAEQIMDYAPTSSESFEFLQK